MLIEALPIEERDRPDNRYLAALCLINSAALELHFGRTSSAKGPMERAVETLERLSLEFPEIQIYILELANIRILYGTVLASEANRTHSGIERIKRRADKNIHLLQQMPRLEEGPTCRGWLYLAESYALKGDLDGGRHWYDKSVQWMEANHIEDNELIRLRAEAAQLLTGNR